MPLLFNFGHLEVTSVPIWVRFPSLPIDLWTDKQLAALGSQLGVPIMTDRLTVSKRVWYYARILVDVDLSGKLFDTIEIHVSNGEVLHQKVVYERMPQFCCTCMQIGHTESKHELDEVHCATYHVPTTKHVSVAPQQPDKSRINVQPKRNNA